MRNHFRLTSREITLAFAIAFLGLVLTLRPVLLFLNLLNPLEGLLVYYVILYCALIILSHFGLTIFHVKITNLIQSFGLILITFAFFISVDMSSAYVQYVTTGNFNGMSNIFVQCEDGAVWYLWTMLIHPASQFAISLDWFLTYGVTPFALAAVGGVLAFKKPRLG